MAVAGRFYKELLFPAVFLLSMTLLFRVTDLDMQLAALFYDPASGWPLGGEFPWLQLYRYGYWPALVLACGSLLFLVFSLASGMRRTWRKPALFFVLLMLLGPGLVVNVVFKDNWDRPRPREIQAFGGEKPFLPVWQKGKGTSSHSFPSGHASMAFYLFSPFFILRRSRPKAARIVLILGLGYGMLMGVARMAQGGHFASDILWAAGFVYFCGLILEFLLRSDKECFG